MNTHTLRPHTTNTKGSTSFPFPFVAPTCQVQCEHSQRQLQWLQAMSAASAAAVGAHCAHASTAGPTWAAVWSVLSALQGQADGVPPCVEAKDNAHVSSAPAVTHAAPAPVFGYEGTALGFVVDTDRVHGASTRGRSRDASSSDRTHGTSAVPSDRIRASCTCRYPRSKSSNDRRCVSGTCCHSRRTCPRGPVRASGTYEAAAPVIAVPRAPAVTHTATAPPHLL